MKTRITKRVGSITDKYRAEISYDEEGGVSQIRFYKLTGHPLNDNVEEVSWFMDGTAAVDIIAAVNQELY